MLDLRCENHQESGDRRQEPGTKKKGFYEGAKERKNERAKERNLVSWSEIAKQFSIDNF